MTHPYLASQLVPRSDFTYHDKIRKAQIIKAFIAKMRTKTSVKRSVYNQTVTVTTHLVQTSEGEG